MLMLFIIVIKCISNTMLESVLFLRHFHALYIRKLQLRKIYGIYNTIDNNNRTNRYTIYAKYNNNDKYTINIINEMYVLFGRYGIFGIYVMCDRSVSFCRFQWSLLKKLIVLFKSIEEVTEWLGGQKYCTLSLIYLFIYALYYYY